MANKASSNLHLLIHSLSKAEKRYFKIYSSKHVINNTSNYQRLFDAVSSQEEYDEEKILHKFRKEGFVRRFSITKNRLYHTILKSLDAFHANSSAETQVKRQIHYIEILYRKSLYKQASKLLNSTKKSAEKHELYTSLLEISKWEKRLMEQMSYEGQDPESIREHYQKDLKVLDHLKEFHSLWQSKSLVFNQLYKTGRSRSQVDKDIFLKAVKPWSESSQPAPTFENTYLYLHTISAFYYGLNELEKCYTYLIANIEHLSTHPEFLKDEPNIFLSVLSNSIFIGNQLGEFERSKDLLRKVKSLPAELGDQMTEDMSMRVFSTASSLELSLHIHSGSFKDAMDFLPNIEEGLMRYGEKLGAVKRAQFYFNMAIVCFGAGKFNESLKWINQLLNNIGIDQSLDIHCFAQLFNLVIHLELGNKSLLGYALRSTQRYLETRNRVYEFESVFLDFVNDSLKKRSKLPDRERYAELRNSLSDLRKSDYERTVFEYFDFEAWAKSKAEGIRFAKALRPDHSD